MGVSVGVGEGISVPEVQDKNVTHLTVYPTKYSLSVSHFTEHATDVSLLLPKKSKVPAKVSSPML